MKVYRSLTRSEEVLIRKVLDKYKFKNQVSIKRNLVAYVNKVYLVEDGKAKYILRQSNPAKELEHLKVEIALLKFLKRKKFKLTAYPIPNREGKDVTIHEGSFYLLQNFMPGDSPVSWNNLSKFNERKLTSFCGASAKFSRAVADFLPPIKFSNHPLPYYLKNAEKIYKKQVDQIKDAKIKRFLNGNRRYILALAKDSSAELEKLRYGKLPKQILHFDFHPGNVNFIGDQVSAIFDFDWIRMDARITDIAATLGQSCYYYGGPKSGMYNKARIRKGLQAYRRAFGEAVINPRQDAFLAPILQGYMFFQLLWCIGWCIENPRHPKGLGYIQFFTKILMLNDFDQLFKQP